MYSFIGKDTPRPDSAEKAAGRAIYIHEIQRPGMLFGKIRYSDRVHARILHIDTSRAEKLPGVRAVITGYNTPEIRIGFLRDNFTLKKGKVRQYRDEIAAVAAISPEIAEEAVSLIRVEYEDLPPLFTPEEALAKDAVLIHETDPRGKPRTDNIVQVPWNFNSGDVEAARRNSTFIAEGEYETPRIQQSCLGTAGCVAEFDLNQNLLIHSKTQIPFLAQNDFNKALATMGLKGKNTRIIVPTIGGGFGTGLDTHAYEYIAILLAWKTGRPVKIVLTREEEFSCQSPRQISKTRIVQGCDREGHLNFRKVEMLLDNGAYSSWGATTPSVMMLPITSLYRVANISYETTIVYTNNTYCQAMRGYGNPQAAWALECNMDQLAETAGIDPYDFRKINANQANEITPMGLMITTCGLTECLDRVAEKLQWEKKRNRKGAVSENGNISSKKETKTASEKKKLRGVGMASLFHVGGSGRVYRSDGSGAILKLDDFGNATVIIGSVEMGQGLLSATTLATAEALGITPDRVNVIWGDTSVCPWDVGTHASRGAFVTCNAVIMAARKAREKIFRIASEHFMSRVRFNLKKQAGKNPGFEMPDIDFHMILRPTEFDLKENFLFLKHSPDSPVFRVELGELLREAHFKEKGTMIVTEAFYDPCNEMLDAKTCRGNLSATYIFGVQGAEVEVDTETGIVEIKNFVAVHDVGKVLNQQTLKGQFYGGIVQGIGFALTEEFISEKGRNLNPDFLDYKILSAMDIDFPIHVDFIETIDEAGPFGAKGVGEPGLVPVAPAIANAIYDAVGVRVTDLPIKPEKILAKLKGKPFEETGNTVLSCRSHV